MSNNVFLKNHAGDIVYPGTTFEQVQDTEGKTLLEWSAEVATVLEGMPIGIDYDSATGTLKLLGAEDAELDSVTIQSGSSVLKSASIENEHPEEGTPGKYLVLTWELADENTSTTVVDLSDLVDLSAYATSEELANVEAKIPDVSDLATKAEVEEFEASLPNTYCVAIVESDTGTSRIQNETTGSGPMYRHVDGTYSYVGVNNGGADGIGVQTYVKDNATGTGTRINVYTKGAFYIPDKSNTDADYVADDPDREIAVKGDLAGFVTSDEIDELKAEIAELKALLESAAYIAKDESADVEGD